MNHTLARHLRTLAYYPRRSPATFAFLVLLVVNAIVVGRLLSQEHADHLVETISTNLDNLEDHPIRALVGSLFVADVHGTWLGNLLTVGFGLGVCMAFLEARVGTLRAIGVTVLGHVGATLVTAAVLVPAIRAGTYPQDTRHTLDYGVSYASMAAIASITPLLPRLYRPWWAGLCLVYPFTSAQWYGELPDFTTIGHVSAALIGLAAGFGCVGRLRPAAGDADPIPGPDPDPDPRRSTGTDPARPPGETVETSGLKRQA